MSKQSWYSITAKADDTAEVMIYSEIGLWGITAEDFVTELKAIKAKTLIVKINSPGGSVFEAFAIYNALNAFDGRVVTCVDGLAASAATVIMLAGDEVQMAKNAFVMIHEAWGLTAGDAGDMRKYADLLDKLNVSIADAYAEQTGKTREEMLALMAVETWCNADEASAIGLIDIVNDDDGGMPEDVAKAIAKFDKAPANLRRIAAKFMDKSGQGVSPLPVGNGAPAAKKKEILMDLESFKAFAAEHPEATLAYREEGKVAAATEAKNSELSRFQAIRAACGGNDKLACDLFAAGKTADDAKMVTDAVSAAATTATAKEQTLTAEIESLKAKAGTQPPIGTAVAAGAGSSASPVTPEDTAKTEWAANKDDCKNKFIRESVYVKSRVRELKSGRVS